MNGRIIWQAEMRKKLYARLLKEFGQYRNWSATRYPSRAQHDKYDEVIKELSVEFSRQTGRSISALAVRQQADWGMTSQRVIKARAFVYSFILNKAAALEVGFISSSDLPTYMNIRTEGRRSRALEEYVELID